MESVFQALVENVAVFRNKRRRTALILGISYCEEAFYVSMSHIYTEYFYSGSHNLRLGKLNSPHTFLLCSRLLGRKSL